MKYFAIVPAGSEELFLEELSFFKVRGKSFEEIVVFESEKINSIIYHSLIPKKICRFVSEGTIGNISADPINPAILPEKDKSFGVRLKHPVNQELKKHYLEAKTGDIINKIFGMKVNLKNPDYWFTIFVSKNHYFLGIDLVSKNLDKRPYRVFNNPQSIKGNIAACALRFAGYDGSQSLVDPFCRAGEIPIEAALISTNTSPWKYEPFDNIDLPDDTLNKSPKEKIYCFDEIMANVNAAKKNAKLAGVGKFIDYSRLDVSWLDTKLEEKSIDLIVTQPPVISKNNKKVHKVIEEFFYQAEFILKPEGKIIIISMNDEESFVSAKKYRFNILRKKIVKSGHQSYNLFELLR